jgi:hypothetical protein
MSLTGDSVRVQVSLCGPKIVDTVSLKNVFPVFFLVSFFFFVALEFKLTASCLVGRYSYHLSYSTSPFL